jgi:hypothetical protein
MAVFKFMEGYNMFKFSKFLLGAICALSISSGQAGLTKYFGMPKTSISPKGDRVAKSYYWSGDLAICDRLTGQMLKTFEGNLNESFVWSSTTAREFIWSQCKNEVVVFKNVNFLLSHDYSFRIYDLDQMEQVWMEGFSSPIKSYSITGKILMLQFEDGSKSNFDLSTRQWVYHCELARKRLDHDRVMKWLPVALLAGAVLKALSGEAV